MPRHEARKRDAVANELESFKAKQEDSGPPKVNLGDGASLKRALDEAAATVLQKQGYQEDYTFSNIRNGGGVFTCLLALLAQFYPKKYPDNFWILLVCVTLYIISTLALSYFFSSIEGDIFYVAKPKMARFSDQYRLSIGRRSSRWRKQVGSPTVDLLDSVTEYFDGDGVLLGDKFKAAVESKLSLFLAQHKKQ